MSYLVCPICYCGLAYQTEDPHVVCCPACGRRFILASVDDRIGETQVGKQKAKV